MARGLHLDGNQTDEARMNKQQNCVRQKFGGLAAVGGCDQ